MRSELLDATASTLRFATLPEAIMPMMTMLNAVAAMASAIDPVLSRSMSARVCKVRARAARMVQACFRSVNTGLPYVGVEPGPDVWPRFLCVRLFLEGG
jgi:hypothetical protein